jgi:hypothetical protein
LGDAIAGIEMRWRELDGLVQDAAGDERAGWIVEEEGWWEEGEREAWVD